jgi:acetyl esterase/lipase
MLAMDEQLLSAVLSLPADRLAASDFARGDWEGVRSFSDRALASLEGDLPEHAEILRTDFAVSSHGGAEILCRWYAPAGSRSETPGASVIYLHGGGMIAGSVALYDRTVASYVADTAVPMLSVDYRRAPEHPHPTPVEDCVAALAWLRTNTAGLPVDPLRIAVMGDSAGGGLAAATALLARDRGIPLAKQLLIYPMLDDRNTMTDPLLVPYAGWSYDDNYTGWHALLGDLIGTAEVPGEAAPARATDLTGLADAYIEVGELDIFRDDAIRYAQRLASSGTSSELHVHAGCPHGFDRLARGVGVAERARQDRLRVMTQI